MAEIERSLEFYICQRLQKWRHLQFELSGARVQVIPFVYCQVKLDIRLLRYLIHACLPQPTRLA